MALLPLITLDRFDGEHFKLSGQAKYAGSAAVFIAPPELLVVWCLITLHQEQCNYHTESTFVRFIPVANGCQYGQPCKPFTPCRFVDIHLSL